MEQQLNVSKLTSSLVESQAENKALLAKLAASRVASSNVEPLSGYSRAPASASKSRGQASRTIMVGSVEAAAAAEIAQLKEDIYSDLTGLILRGVDRRDDADVYDCIQTGRNGSMYLALMEGTLLMPSSSSLPPCHHKAKRTNRQPPFDHLRRGRIHLHSPTRHQSRRRSSRHSA